MLTTPSATGSLSGLRLDFNGPPPGVGGDIEPQAFTQVFVATGTFDGTSLMLPPVTLAVSFSRPGFQGIPAFNLSSVGLPILSLDTPGAAELLIGVTFQVPNNPGLIRFDVRGRELARTFAAPELSSLECLFVGLLALVARAAWRGRAVPRALS
jgi:hypothetical protein